MSDPSIQSYKRSMYKSELDDLGKVNLNDGFFNYGIHVQHYSGAKHVMPEIIGRWVSRIQEAHPERGAVVVRRPLVPCTEVFTNLN